MLLQSQEPVPKQNAKSVLDAGGPAELAKWVVAQNQVLLTDTTFRDAHQSLVSVVAQLLLSTQLSTAPTHSL